ncbi:unnamed protein product [Amoebophrya sp. A25]|nr:unnamed protein product [Amoebophrya sp. A25]|eukprot:GSA25T00022973001.1
MKNMLSRPRRRFTRVVWVVGAGLLSTSLCCEAASVVDPGGQRFTSNHVVVGPPPGLERPEDQDVALELLNEELGFSDIGFGCPGIVAGAILQDDTSVNVRVKTGSKANENVAVGDVGGGAGRPSSAGSNTMVDRKGSKGSSGGSSTGGQSKISVKTTAEDIQTSRGPQLRTFKPPAAVVASAGAQEQYGSNGNSNGNVVARGKHHPGTNRKTSGAGQLHHQEQSGCGATSASRMHARSKTYHVNHYNSNPLPLSSSPGFVPDFNAQYYASSGYPAPGYDASTSGSYGSAYPYYPPHHHGAPPAPYAGPGTMHMQQYADPSAGAYAVQHDVHTYGGATTGYQHQYQYQSPVHPQHQQQMYEVNAATTAPGPYVDPGQQQGYHPLPGTGGSDYHSMIQSTANAWHQAATGEHQHQFLPKHHHQEHQVPHQPRQSYIQNDPINNYHGYVGALAGTDAKSVFDQRRSSPPAQAQISSPPKTLPFDPTAIVVERAESRKHGHRHPLLSYAEQVAPVEQEYSNKYEEYAPEHEAEQAAYKNFFYASSSLQMKQQQLQQLQHDQHPNRPSAPQLFVFNPITGKPEALAASSTTRTTEEEQGQATRDRSPKDFEKIVSDIQRKLSYSFDHSTEHEQQDASSKTLWPGQATTVEFLGLNTPPLVAAPGTASPPPHAASPPPTQEQGTASPPPHAASPPPTQAHPVVFASGHEKMNQFSHPYKGNNEQLVQHAAQPGAGFALSKEQSSQDFLAANAFKNVLGHTASATTTVPNTTVLNTAVPNWDNYTDEDLKVVPESVVHAIAPVEVDAGYKQGPPATLEDEELMIQQGWDNAGNIFEDEK